MFKVTGVKTPHEPGAHRGSGVCRDSNGSWAGWRKTWANNETVLRYNQAYTGRALPSNLLPRQDGAGSENGGLSTPGVSG